MPMKREVAARLVLPAYPRSARYDIDWVAENAMGPHPLWLAEALTDNMDLAPGLRVLDLGCGRALTSIFLAREFDVQVWAADLWIDASENWERVQAASLTDRVFPLNAEACSLPFPRRFFDAIVSLDAYHYFGTDELYLAHLGRFLKPGGQIGIVVPAFQRELEALPPALARFPWAPDCWTFHSPVWWRRHWERSGLVDVLVADLLPDGWRHWFLWEEACGEGFDVEPWEGAADIREDAGATLGFTRLIARRNDREPPFDYKTGAALS